MVSHPPRIGRPTSRNFRLGSLQPHRANHDSDACHSRRNRQTHSARQLAVNRRTYSGCQTRLDPSCQPHFRNRPAKCSPSRNSRISRRSAYPCATLLGLAFVQVILNISQGLSGMPRCVCHLRQPLPESITSIRRGSALIEMYIPRLFAIKLHGKRKQQVLEGKSCRKISASHQSNSANCLTTGSLIPKGTSGLTRLTSLALPALRSGPVRIPQKS